MHSDTDLERLTETTPLLIDASSSIPTTQPVPYIHPTLEHVQEIDVRELRFSHLCPYTLPTRAAEFAFALVILLQWRLNIVRRCVYSQDLWDHWSKEQDDARILKELEQRILGLWTEFLQDYRSSQDIEDILWFAFSDREASLRVLRGLSIRLSWPSSMS